MRKKVNCTRVNNWNRCDVRTVAHKSKICARFNFLWFFTTFLPTLLVYLNALPSSGKKIFVKEPRYSEHILPVSWPLVISRYHATISKFPRNWFYQAAVFNDSINTSWINSAGLKPWANLHLKTYNYNEIRNILVWPYTSMAPNENIFQVGGLTRSCIGSRYTVNSPFVYFTSWTFSAILS